LELKPEIHLKQQQKLVITPQLQQAIKMLQLSNLELSEKIDEELVENPALETEDRESDFERNVDRELSAEDRTNRLEDGFEDEYFFEDKSFTRIGESSGEDKKREFIEGALSREETLKEYLHWQLQLLDLSQEELQTAEALVSCIDTQGYLPLSDEQLSADLQIPLGEVRKIVQIIQSLDPPGVGARDIGECLLIQLRRRGHYPVAEKIVKEHLNDVKLKKFDDIARKMKVSLAGIREAFDLISRLEPYPGRQFYSEETKYIIPEVIIEERDGKYEVLASNYSLPRLRVNRYYERLLARKDMDKRIKEFAADKVQKAKNFIRSIEQRESTLIRVTRTILEEQREFFEKGPKHLKPLTLKDVSTSIGLHESTVSRITSSKYVQTPFGVFPLKYFFSNPIPASGNKEYSATSIREMIKDIIQNEAVKKNLSDQKIADLLAQRGIKIARRTVSKYRKSLNILPSNLRR
jgi:RNA polymerase sigma-54 factor